MEFVGVLVLGGLAGWLIAHQYYLRASRDAEVQANQQNRNAEVLAQLQLLLNQGATVDYIRADDGGLRGVNLIIDVPAGELGIQGHAPSAPVDDPNSPGDD